MQHLLQIAAISNAPLDKVGVASGIYKMASSLGGAFGVAISGAVYVGAVAATSIHTGAMIALWVNVLMESWHLSQFYSRFLMMINVSKMRIITMTRQVF